MAELEKRPMAPVARRGSHVEVRHREQVADPYHWLRDDSRQDPEVLAYLEEENAYTETVMEPTEELQERLYSEMLGRIQEDDETVPQRYGEYHYYSRTEKGKQYRIWCRKHRTLEAEEEVLLDGNVLGEGQPYFRLGAMAISPDHGQLAFASDVTGGETYTIRIKELASGELLEETIEQAYDSLQWSADGKTIFYNTLDRAHRPYRLWRHRLGTARSEDVLVYEERDESFFLGLYKTKSRRFLMLDLGSNNTSELRFLDAADPEGEFRTIRARRSGVEYAVTHHDDRFFVLTNEEATNFRMMEASLDDPGEWREVIAHRPDVKLEAIEAFARHLVLVERKNGLRGMRIFDPPCRNERRVPFDEAVYSFRLSSNPEFDTDLVRFTYESLVTPESVFDLNMRTGERELRKEQPVLGGYDKSAYRTERLHATAPDGTQVPISLVCRADLARDGSNPLLLYGYGSYGSVHTDPSFASTRLSLLERGVVFAIAHVRGGGDLGRPWYDAGKLLHKKNTFTDFIACAEHLVEQGRTSPERLALRGGSAGGLLVGAVINLRPDLFHAGVANVPFVDVMNTMLDATLPLTVIEREEWGDPRNKGFYDYMRSYSPYDNVAAKDYPHMLVTAGLHDPRVAYWEPAKWVARLRATKTDDRLLLLKTNLGAGHSGASGRYAGLRELGLEYAFLLDRLGVAER